MVRRFFGVVLINGRPIVLGAVVLSGFLWGGLGAAVAWHSQDSAALFIAALLLVAGGMFGDSVTDLTAKWGDKEVNIRRLEELVREQTEPVVRRVDELAADPATPEPVKKELREIRHAVDEARAIDTGTSSRGRDASRRVPYEATHLISSSGDVGLQLAGRRSSLVGLPVQARCTVTAPSGVTATVERVMTGANFLIERSDVSVRWPDDFPEGVGGETGKHLVDWSVNDPMSLSARAMGLSSWTRVAIDDFAI